MGALCSWQVQPCHAGEGSDKKALWSSRLAVGREASFLTPENKLTAVATETPTRELLREIPNLREEGSSVRRSMKSSGESLRYLEAAGRNRLSLFRDTIMGTWNVRTMFQSGKACTNSSRDAEVQHSSARNQRI